MSENAIPPAQEIVPETKPPKHRVQCDLTPRMVQRIDEMCEKFSIPNRVEVIRNAINLYDLVVQNIGKPITLKMSDMGVIVQVNPED